MKPKLEQLLDESTGATVAIRQTAAQWTACCRTIRNGSPRPSKACSRMPTALGRMADQINNMVAENREGVRDFTQTGLYEITGLAQDAQRMTDQISRVMEDLERDPARFLFGNRTQGIEAAIGNETMTKHRALDRRNGLRLAATLPLAFIAGCQLPGSGAPPRTFRLSPKTTFDELPEVDWVLVVDRPQISRSIDTVRIARFDAVEIEYYADAAWVDRPGSMIQPLLIQSFRSSGAIEVVADRRSDIRPDFMLQTDISAFYALPNETGPTEARVVISATLLSMPQREVVGTTEIGRTVAGHRQ